MPLLERILRHNGIGFDLNEPRRIDETAHLDNGARGPDVSEELSMDSSNRLPILDSGKQYAGADHVGDVRAQCVKRLVYDLEATARLRRGISRADRGSVVRERSSA
jgi:hypothetical protein